MNKGKNSSPEEILTSLKIAKSILINMDIRFDYDALCSSLALSYVLQRDFNKNTTIIHTGVLDPDSSNYFDTSKIKTNTDIADVDLENYDLIINLDSGKSDHVSKKEFTFPKDKVVINIDHHITNDYFGTLNYVNFFASNCTNLFKLFTELDIKIDNTLAKQVAFGLMTDSGFFSYNTVTSYDFRVAAKLTDLGINFNKLSSTLKFNVPIDVYKMQKIIMNNLAVNEKERYAYSYYSQKDLTDNNIKSEKVVISPPDMFKYLGIVDYVFVVRDEPDGTYKVSFRTANSDVSVADICSSLGGGGHEKAAGARIGEQKSLHDAINYVINHLPEPSSN